MENTLSAKALVGYAIHATDGSIGKVLELYFDDSTFAVRYVVVDVAQWLLHKKVLISPEAFGRPDVEKRYIPVYITREQVRQSPRLETDKPVALQAQALLHAHYGWEYYWVAEALLSSSGLFTPPPPVNEDGKPFDPHLRTTRVVAGHRVWTENGPVGRVDDFTIDCQTWTIRNLVVRTDEGKGVDFPPSAITHISFEDSLVFVNNSASVS